MSIMVLRRLILSPRFHAVMTVTQSLPVAPIPEQLHVTTVRNDVVDVRCLHVRPFLHTLHTQRVHLQVLLPGLSPSCSVASARSGPHLFRVHGLMLLAVLLS